ncbi:hypothetical protein EON66_00740 [archaeon]|nr:MAG: hypothetical protein EON66_00740 [archaeon]
MQSGEALEELEEMDDLERDKARSKPGLIARAKMAVFEGVQRYGFIAVLLGASIPNPVRTQRT